MALTDVDADLAILRRPVPDGHLRRLLTAADRLATTVESPEAVAPVLAEAALGLPADLAVVWLLGDDGTSMQAPLSRERVSPRSTGLLASLDGDGPDVTDGAALAGVVRTGRPARLDLPASAEALPPRVRAALESEGAGVVLAAPVHGRDRVVGVVLVARRRPCPAFGTDDVDALVLLGRRGGAALETARLLAAVRVQADLVETVSDAVIATDRQGVVTAWNGAAARIYGIPAASARGRLLDELLVRTEYVGSTRQEALDAVTATGVWRGRVRQTSHAGATVEVESSVSVRRTARGDDDGLVAVNRDITEVLAARADAREAERFARQLMEAVDSDAAVLDRAGVVVACNERWRAALQRRERCSCGPVAEGEGWLEALRATPDPDASALADGVASVLSGALPLAQMECRCSAGGAETATAIEVVGLQGVHAGAFVVQSDVTWRRQMQDELEHRATHDELTGLPNRAALVEVLEASLSRLDGRGHLAVLFCDLDGFKDVNDGLGHAVGDQVLVAVARRLRQRCRSADVVARFGGDEFVVVLSVPAVSQAVVMAERIVEALSHPISVGDAEVAPGVSVGITVVDAPPDDTDPVGTLLRDADTAMYQAKERGRGRYEFFDAGLRRNIAERLELTAALRRAIVADELELVYQTRRFCGDRRVAGVEALLQWNHPELGRVDPRVFVPIAERSGRIVDLGAWALGQALSQVAAHPDGPPSVAVNVSPRQLTTPRLVDTVRDALAASGLAPQRLMLEITEGALVEEPETARQVLTALRDLGVTVALDDFGTGWSALSYLRTLPVDVIKIDRSFVADLPSDPDACAVVAAVLGLGHGMGLIVVAEGVETQEQLDILREMGCDEYQGFLDGRPAALAQVMSSGAAGRTAG